MKEFPIRNKLYIAFIFAISVALTTNAISDTSYAQNNSITSEGTTGSLNNSPIEPANTTTTESVSVPVSKGYVNGNISFFIATDASVKEIVSSVTNTTNFNINYAPSLANTSESSRQQGYVFTNGIRGEGQAGFQLPVASSAPDDENYSPLFAINYVEWNDGSNAKVLKSVNEVLEAQNKGEISITKTNIVINSPGVQMK
ncbi:MAG TPA: hypothetical protein VER14_00525 [Phototrophicaceae bacterium]|nr:hypothetical protein [Phototrophicaceae bacterium]